MEYGLLGPFRVLDDEGADVQPSAPKVRTLLALLLLNRGQPVSADRIADTLWGDEPPRSAPNLVHGYVRDLRRQVGIQEISTVTGGYRIDVPRDSVDAFRFEDLSRRAGTAKHWHSGAGQPCSNGPRNPGLERLPRAWRGSVSPRWSRA